jgi:hypothetical protein
VERIGGPAAEEALTQAARALDEAADRMPNDTATWRRSQETHFQGAVDGFLPALMDAVEYVDGQLQGLVVFPDASIEGNRWVDAGSVSLVFEQFLGDLASRHGLVHRSASLSVDFLCLVPRNRDLTLRGPTEERDATGQLLYASLSDGARVVAEARGRYVQL